MRDRWNKAIEIRLAAARERARVEHREKELKVTAILKRSRGERLTFEGRAAAFWRRAGGLPKRPSRRGDDGLEPAPVLPRPNQPTLSGGAEAPLD